LYLETADGVIFPSTL